MKSQSRFCFVAPPCSHWLQRRSLILGSSLLLLAAVLMWQVSARFAASAKSNPLVTTTIESIAPEPAAVVQGGGCNNCCGSWSQKTNAAPAPRDIHAMAYAQNCNRVVMFGGRTAAGVSPAFVTDETWEWNGTTMTWAQFTPAIRPAPRGQHAMAYDAARKQVVLFGGFSSSFIGLNDTWVYDCVTHTWTQKFPANSPSGRHAHAMAYDPNSGLVVLYGGSSTLSDTWTWDGSNWAQVAGANQPGIRYEHAMAFDGTRVILFGGSKNAGFADNDTWDLTLTSPTAGTWTMIAPNGSGPNKRQRHAMAYAPNCQKVILFGGNTDIATYSNDTWEWRRATLSWCQTSVPTPPTAPRQYPAMAYDGKGALMYGGLNSSLAQLGDTWRFACSTAYTFRSGYMDNFGSAPPIDPFPSATSAFVANIDAVYSTPPKKGFDDATVNRFFLQSFTGLPSNIVKAELEIRMSPDAGGTSNDSIHFDFPPFNAPSFTWGQNIRNLHPGGTWDTGQGAYTFTLDLCNLPAGAAGQPTNLLGLINANHSLHIMVQDDTNVDYIKLRVTACPQKKYYAGLPVEPVGQSQLGEDANGNLLISNIGSSGNDGATFALGETQALTMESADLLSDMPIGSYMQSQSFGRIGGVPGSPAGGFRISRAADGRTTFEPDFNAIGSPTFHLGFYLDGTPVNLQGGLSGNTLSWAPGNLRLTIKCSWKLGIWLIHTVTGNFLLRVGDQDVGIGNTLVVTAENPTQTVESVSQAVLTGAMLPAMRVGAVSIDPGLLSGLDRTPVKSLGLASLEAFANNLAVSNIGSSGQDGVSINLGKALNAELSFDTMNPLNDLPHGANIRVTPTAFANNQSVSLGSLTVSQSRVPNFPWEPVTADFSAIGSPLQRVQIFDGNTPVADVSDFSGDVSASQSPNRIGGLLPGFTAVFPPSTTFKLGMLMVQGDNIRITPLTSNVTPTYLTDFTVTAADMREFTITGTTVTPFCNSTINLSPATLPIGRVGAIFNQTFSASGGSAPYSFARTTGTLPPGLTLRSTGVLSGTPTSAGVFTFTVQATDDNGCTGTKSYDLTTIICQTITVGPPSLVAGTVGSAYSQTFTASGGTGPYTFARTTGTLPPGLTLSGSGALSGTPTAAGTFNFTVQATDSGGCTQTKAYTLTINSGCAIVVSPATAPNGFVGTAYNQPFTASGGVAPYTFTRTSGTLPPGLTMPVNGLLSGTPTTQGTYTFTVQATDSNNCTGSRDYTVTISGSGLQFFTLPTPVRIVDTRPGQAACSLPGNPIAGGTSLTQAAAGFCGIPSTARAIMGNVTVVTPAANGFVTIFPSNSVQPTAANTNFIVGDVLNNVFTVGLGPADGAFKIFASTTVNVVIDVTGYFAPPAAGGLFLHMLPTPIRLEDTRVGQTACITPGAPLPGGVDTTHQGTTTCNGVTIPSVARAILGNVTVVLPAANGFITAFPGDAPSRPLAASGNYRSGSILNSPFTVGLSPTGQFKLYSVATTDVVIDVLGYFSPDLVDVNGTGLLFTPLTPARLVDSRPGQPACFNLGAPLASGVEQLQGAANSCTIASTARAVLGNVTVVIPPANGFLTFWPSDTPRPLISTSNYQAGRNFNRFFTTGLGAANGAFKMFSSQSINLVVDVSGYFAP